MTLCSHENLYGHTCGLQDEHVLSSKENPIHECRQMMRVSHGPAFTVAQCQARWTLSDDEPTYPEEEAQFLGGES